MTITELIHFSTKIFYASQTGASFETVQTALPFALRIFPTVFIYFSLLVTKSTALVNEIVLLS